MRRLGPVERSPIRLGGFGVDHLRNVRRFLTTAAFEPAPAASASPTITQYSVPTPSSSPEGITTGPDGALWFTEQRSNQTGRITTPGSIKEYPAPTVNTPSWYRSRVRRSTLVHRTQSAPRSAELRRIRTSGVLTEYVMPSTNASPNQIVAGSDGALWFTDRS